MHRDPDPRPLLALTMGDPAGVGPEIMVLALSDPAVYQACRPLVLGDLEALERARRALAPQLTLHPVQNLSEGLYRVGAIDLWPLSRLSPDDLNHSHPSAAGGHAMVTYILTAIELAMKGEVAGMVTGPISKAALNLAGYRYPGHTELLAERTGATEVAMMLAGGNFRVVLATIHIALAEVCAFSASPAGPWNRTSPFLIPAWAWRLLTLTPARGACSGMKKKKSSSPQFWRPGVRACR